jgi:transposase InsO family protein
LDREVFASVKEAAVLLSDDRRSYNADRPHSSLGYVAPAVFAAQFVPPPSASLRPASQTE